MGTLAGHRYVTRAEWGARPPTDPLVSMSPGATPRLWIHHSADDRQGAAAVRAHQEFHQDSRGWKDIAYNFLVGNDGTLFEGRGARIVGGATAGDNSTSHAICLLGNFQSYGPSVDQWRALVDLVRHGRDHRWWVPTCGGHRDAPQAQTACPGDHLYRRLPELRQAILLPATPPEDPDMAFTDDHAAKLEELHEALTSGRFARQVWAHDVAKLPTNPGAAADLMRRIRAGVGVDVDEAAVAAALAPVLSAALVDALPDDVTGQLSEEQVEDAAETALRRVLADAGSE